MAQVEVGIAMGRDAEVANDSAVSALVKGDLNGYRPGPKAGAGDHAEHQAEFVLRVCL